MLPYVNAILLMFEPFENICKVQAVNLQSLKYTQIFKDVSKSELQHVERPYDTLQGQHIFVFILLKWESIVLQQPSKEHLFFLFVYFTFFSFSFIEDQHLFLVSVVFG